MARIGTKEDESAIERALGSLVLRQKGREHFTICFTSTGAYIECWLYRQENNENLRVIECNFFDGSTRDLDWTTEALGALMLARAWQTGDVTMDDLAEELTKG